MTTQYLKRLGVWHSYFLCLRRHLGELVPTLPTLLSQLEGEVCISPIHRQVSLRKEKLVWGLQGYLLAIHASFLGWQGTLIFLRGSAFSHPQSLHLPWGGRAGITPLLRGRTCDPGRANWRSLSLRAWHGSRDAQMIRSHQGDYREGALDRDFYTWGFSVGRTKAWKRGKILQESEGQTARQSHKVEKGRKASGLDLKSWGSIWSERAWNKLATGVFNCVWQ